MSDELHETDGEDAAKQLLSLADAAEISGLSQGHMRLLVRQKKLWGIKLGRNWVTTKAAVDSYLATNPRPGPQPKK